MNVNSSYSQKPLLQPIKIGNENGFKANEVVMDSIFETYNNFEKLKISSDSLHLEVTVLKADISRLVASINSLQSENQHLIYLKKNLKKRVAISEEKRTTEVALWKTKAKGKLKSFLYGTSVGAFIALVLTIIFK